MTNKVFIQIFFFAFTIGFVLNPGSGFIQASEQRAKELNHNSTLNDYLEYAALNNPGLKAAFNRWQAALEKIPQMRSLPDPKLNFGYFIREVETRVGPQQGKVGIMQVFPWFGKLKLKGNAAAEMANAQRQIYQKAKLNLFYRVKGAYYEYYYITKALSVIEGNIQLLEYLEGAVRSKYSTGMESHATLIKVQVELEKLQDWYRTMKDMVRPVTAKLNAALNRSPRAPLPAPQSIIKKDFSMDYTNLVTLLKEKNPDLMALDSMAIKEKIGVKLAKKNYYPNFSLGLDYMFTGQATMPGVSESGKDPLVAMLSINLPIKYKKYKASVREAKARQDSVRMQKEEKTNNLISHLEMIFYKVNDSMRKISLYKDSLIPKAKQAFEVTQSAFEAGKVDFLNLIDSQRILLGFELAYERSLTNYNQRIAELEMLVGQNLTKN
jgi:outer membrane protein TolC